MISRRKSEYDAIVVGSGPNGLCAAITLAQAGLSVKLFESTGTVGGGARSAELTLPSYMHDVCSAVHPMAAVSPYLRSLRLESFGLKWIQPRAAFAHPLDDGRAVVLQGLGWTLPGVEAEASAWRALFEPWTKGGSALAADMLNAPWVPRRPLAMADFGLKAALSAKSLAFRHFKTAEARALFAGLAGHSLLPFERAFSSAAALALGVAAHAAGWPIPERGSQSISDALAECFRSLGGEIALDSPIRSLKQLPTTPMILLDVYAKSFPDLCDGRLPASYKRKLERFRPGSGVFKVDWALSEPVPWASEACRSAGTLHIGGSFEEIAAAERETASGRAPEKPFVLASQPSLFDRTRTPPGKHILWAYCHVPLYSDLDMTARIEGQIERFAPGFRDCILSRRSTTPSGLTAYNSNCPGGDITGGAMDWPQIFRRPTSWMYPYHTPIDGVFLCSASTPPGPGVHGMCGHRAAKAALRALRNRR